MNQDNLKKTFFIFLSVIFSIFIVCFLWENIKLPSHNTLFTSNFWELRSYNPNNDTLRFIIFVSMPLITYLFLSKKLKKKNIKLKSLLYENKKRIINYHPGIILLALIFISLIFLEFFSINFPITGEFSKYKLDLLHDGNYLTPTQNYLSTNSFWLSSFLIHGSSDILYTLFFWKIFGIKSIAAYKTTSIFLILIIKILCILLSYQLTKITNLKHETKILFFSILSAIIVSMSFFKFTGGGSSYYITDRDIYVILFLIFFVELFIKSKFKILSTVLICVISTLSIILHIDTGAYLNFILIFYSFYLLITKKYKDIFIILVSLSLCWGIIIIFFGINEFFAFIENFKIMALTMDVMHGLKYPTPFFSIGSDPDGTRATRGVVLQITAGLFILNSLLSGKNNFRTKRIFFVFLFLLSLIEYKNGLGRSDSGHIRNSQEIPIIINSFFILNFFLVFLEKKIFAIKFSPYKFFMGVSILFLVFYSVFNNNHYKINNIINYKNNFNNFITLNDKAFLHQDTIKFINYFKNISIDDKCVEIISFDDAMPYLLKKPSCTKYWNSWLASPKNVQKKYIDELKKIKPRFILFSSSVATLDGISIYDRINLVHSHVLSNYKKYNEIYGFIIFEKKN